MKKFTKLMTVAGCALLVGGGLSLYAATRSAGDIQTYADDTTYSAAILYGDKWDESELYNGGVATSSLGQAQYAFVVFDYDSENKTAKEIETLNEGNITFALNGVKVSSLTFGNNNGLTIDQFYLNGSLPSYNMGWLEEGNGLFFTDGWTYFQTSGPGDYVMNIPAGLVTFKDGTQNEEINLSFSIYGTMNPAWTVSGQYIPMDDVKAGITFTFDEVTNVTVEDETTQFTVGSNTAYTSSDLKINGNKVTLPSVENIQDGSSLYIYIPQGYFKGTGANGTYLSGYIEKNYTVWGGMQTSATLVDKLPSYVAQGSNVDLIIQWPGEAVTLANSAMSGNINLTFNGAKNGSSFERYCTIQSAGDGTNNLVISNFLEGVEPGQYSPGLKVTIPQNSVYNADGLTNLTQQVASFNYVSLFTDTDFNSEINCEDGVVTVAYSGGTEFSNLMSINYTGISPMIEILEDENVIATLSENDLKSIEYNADDPKYGFTIDLNGINGLLPNQDYTLRINEFAFNLFAANEDWDMYYFYNPEITTTIKNDVSIDGYDLGTGTLYPLSPYYNLPDYNQPATYFTVYWGQVDDAETVYVFDPTKISGTVKGISMTGITVEATSYPVNGLKINIPTAYQNNYCEFEFTLAQGLVYNSDNQSNTETTITFSTYGQISSEYMKVTPEQGQKLTSAELSKIEISWEGFESGVDSMTVEKGAGNIQINAAGSGYEDIDESLIEVVGDKLVIDISSYVTKNGSYDIMIQTGAAVVSTDMGNNWINYYASFYYNVWDGMEEAEVEGLSGMVSETTVQEFDGIYTLTWGKNVTPTTTFKVSKNFTVGGLQDAQEISQDLFTFLDENMQPVSDWNQGGMYLQLDAKELIVEGMEEGFTSFSFTIEEESVIGGSATDINPRQSFGSFEIQEVAETLATISGPEDGVVTIAWPKTYWVASISNGKKIQLLDGNGAVVGEYGFTTDVWQSPIVTEDADSPLQFLLEGSTIYANGFELNLNALNLEYDTYTVVVPEGTLYLVDTNKRNNDGYQPPINAEQSYSFEFGAYPNYTGEIEVTPTTGGTVESLPTVTVTFTDATSVTLVELPYVNGEQLTASSVTVTNNIITITPGVTADGAVTVEIPAGAVVIEGQYTNDEAITASYTIDHMVGVGAIYAVDGRYEVYTVNGVKVLSTEDATELGKLENGLYIINGQKVYLRK